MKDTPDVSNLQKCADFAYAFILGFDVASAFALLRLDDLYVDSFEIKSRLSTGSTVLVLLAGFQGKEAKQSLPSKMPLELE